MREAWRPEKGAALRAVLCLRHEIDSDNIHSRELQ